MRVVCPQDVTIRECEELKERVWLEPSQTMLRSKTNEDRHAPTREEKNGRAQRMGAAKTLRY